MNLLENPIFLTQKRLVHRAGVLAPILIAAVIGLSLLGGLIAYIFDPLTFDFRSVAEVGKVFYSWIIVMQAVALLLVGATKIVQTVAEERKAGLIDSNRLTPLRPCEIVAGYWLGSPLAEFYMTVVLGVIGFVITLVASLPVGLWLGTQMLIFGTALVVGLFGVLTGMTMQKTHTTFLVLLFLVFLFMPFVFGYPKINLINFLLPIYATLNLLWDGGGETGRISDWIGWPTIFGQHIPPVLLTLLCQAILGIVFWRGAVRKAASPFQLMPRWDAVAIFALLVWAQHGLMWNVWRGQWPMKNSWVEEIPGMLLAAIHACTIILGAAILAFIAPDTQRVRLDLLRAAAPGFGLVLRRSSVPFAFVLTAIAGSATATHIIHSWHEAGKAFALAVCSLLICFLSFVLLLEFCRLQFNQSAPGFFAFGMFVLWALPFVLACIFPDSSLGNFSFIAPGIVALTEPYTHGQRFELTRVLSIQIGIVMLLFIAWLFRWKKTIADLCAEPK